MEYYCTRRIVTNCILGSALVLPMALAMLGGVTSPDGDTIVFAWGEVSWISLGIAALYGGISFQYCSICFARRKGINLALLVSAGIGGVIVTTFAVDLLVLLVMAEPKVVSGLSFTLILLSGSILGPVLWMRANGVSVSHVIDV